MNKETDLLSQAMAQVTIATGNGVREDYRRGERVWRVLVGAGAVELEVHPVGRLDKASLAELVSEFGGDEGAIAVVEHATPDQAAQLREGAVNYADTSGNVYVRSGSVLILVDRPQRKRKRKVPAAGRAFQPAGLRVVLALLTDTERVDHPYRELADQAGVSTGAVKYALDDLERSGHLIKVGEGRSMRRRLTDARGLAKKWAERYGEVLRPKLELGRFRFLDPERARSWRQVKLDAAYSCWGGEPAADTYTQYLRPEVLTIYTEVGTAAIAKTHRMVPDPEGPIEVLEKFWRDDVAPVQGGDSNDPRRSWDPQGSDSGVPTAPEIVVYADLLASGVTRNLEVAPSLLEMWCRENEG